MITYKASLLGKLDPATIKKLGKLTFGSEGTMANHIDVALSKYPDEEPANDEFVVVAYEDKKPVGWSLCMIIHNNEAHIGVYVHPEYRNEGIGTKLVNMMKKVIKKKNLAKKVVVNYHDVPSQQFYKKMGATLDKTSTKDMDYGSGHIKLEAFDPTKVIVGAILNNSEIIAKSNIGTHEELLRLFGRSSFDLKHQWRYNKREQTVYWWDTVTQDDKDDVEWYLKRKFGVEVKKHTHISADDSWKNWDLAHGKIEYDAQGNPINEDAGGLIAVGVVYNDGRVWSSDRISMHSYISDFRSVKFSWRYRKDNNTVYWWPPGEGGDSEEDLSQDEIDSVNHHLLTKYGAKNVRHQSIGVAGSSDRKANFRLSHGADLDETIDEAPSKDIVVGAVMYDGRVVSAKNVDGHADVYGKFGTNAQSAAFPWRYHAKTKKVYWWERSPNRDEADEMNVEYHLEKKYGFTVTGHEAMFVGGVDADYRNFNIAHGETKLEESHDGKIIVGVLKVDDSIWSDKNAEGHGDITGGYRPTDIKFAWRYRKPNNTLYWWPSETAGYSNPKAVDKEMVEYHLHKKYGELVAFHKMIDVHNPSFGQSHGFGLEENIMKQLLKEGIKEKAAEDFIRDTIRGTEWEGKVFVAGGYVRDEFMGKDPKDLDLLVNAPEGGIKFAEWITQKLGVRTSGNPVTFPRFGTAKFNMRGVTHNGIEIGDMDIEAVMPRKEQYTAGSRKPTVTGGELKDDVERRDFTVNSLLKDLSTGEILDLTGLGKEDIKAGIVRTPLSPDKIFTDDPLRMLRAVRFTMKYNWKLPMFMLRGLKKNAAQLQNISQERIRDELDKMLMTGSPDRAIKLLKVTGLLRYVIPEMEKAVGMTQNVHHKHDVFGHTLQVIKGTNPVLIQRLAALLHDIGKIVTKSVTPTGVHFYGHEEEGEKIAEEVMRRLKYPIEIINAVKKTVRNHMRLKSAGDEAVNLSDKALRKFRADMGDELENVLAVIHADNVAHADASAMPNQIDNIRKRLDSLKAVAVQPKLPISGFDLVKMGLKPGPQFKEILSAVTDAWFENPNITREQAMEIVNRMI